MSESTESTAIPNNGAKGGDSAQKTVRIFCLSPFRLFTNSVSLSLLFMVVGSPILGKLLRRNGGGMVASSRASRDDLAPSDKARVGRVKMEICFILKMKYNWKWHKTPEDSFTIHEPGLYEKKVIAKYCD